MWICQSDFGGSKDQCTYKIKCPGTYKLKENISFRSKKNKVAAILIDCDNVVLDLNSKVLKQSSKSDKTQISGVVIATGHRNVTILGNYGTIKNFSKSGIYVEGGNDYVTLGDDTQLTISGCGYGTKKSFVDVVSGVEEGVTQCGLQLGDQEYSAAIPYPTFNDTNNVSRFNGVLNHVTLKNLTISGNNTGCYLGEGTDYTFTNCSFSQNPDSRLLWEKVANLGGFYEKISVVSHGLIYLSNPIFTPAPNVGLNNLSVINCKFNGNVSDGSVKNASGSYCNGFLFTNNFKNLKIMGSEFNQNESKLGVDGVFSKVIGLVVGAGIGTVVENSQFSDNKAGSEVVGCSMSGLSANLSGTSVTDRTVSPSESVTIRNCVAARNLAQTNVTDLQSVDVRGFSLKYPSGATLIECVSEDNKALLSEDNKDTVAGFADGIFIFSDPADQDTFTNNVEIRGCKISRNRVTLPTGSTGAGVAQGTSSGIRVFDDLCENILIRDCFISDNRPDKDEPAAPDTFITTGIDLFNEGEQTGESFVTISNNVISNNGAVGIDNNLVLTTIEKNTIKSHSFTSILSGAAGELNNCGTFIDNTLLRSDFAVVDLEVPSTTLVAGNKSYNTPCGYQVSYAGGVPVEVTASLLPAFPAVPTVAWSNVQIDNPACGGCPEAAAQKLQKAKSSTSKQMTSYRDSKKAVMSKRKL